MAIHVRILEMRNYYRCCSSNKYDRFGFYNINISAAIPSGFFYVPDITLNNIPDNNCGMQSR